MTDVLILECFIALASHIHFSFPLLAVPKLTKS
jgi:hypothetical protein